MSTTRWTIDAPSNSQYEEDPDGEWVHWDDVGGVLNAVAALSDAQLLWWRNSGAFRHICLAEIARRKAEAWKP